MKKYHKFGFTPKNDLFDKYEPELLDFKFEDDPTLSL